MEELDSLARQKAWSEMVFLLKEVPAADRNARWEAMVEKASLGHLDTIAVAAGAEAGSTANVLLEEYPSLRRSRKYLEKRIEVSLTALRKCYENPFIEDECGGRLLDLAKGESRDAVLVRRAAGIVVEKESAEAALPFLQLALAKGIPDRVCREDLWQKVVLGALGSAEPSPRREAKGIASQTCWTHLKAKLPAELARRPSSLITICDLLREKKSLTPEQAKLCPAPAPAKAPVNANAPS